MTNLNQAKPSATSAIARWMPFEWLVALRFLREGRVQTLFIIGGVAIGVGVIVFMSALLSGLQATFVKRVLTGQAHIQLLPPKEVSRLIPLSEPHGVRDDIVQAPLQRAKSIDQWQS
jgi:lipoprotein-releasing system permease protein